MKPSKKRTIDNNVKELGLGGDSRRLRVKDGLLNPHLNYRGLVGLFLCKFDRQTLILSITGFL